MLHKQSCPKVAPTNMGNQNKIQFSIRNFRWQKAIAADNALEDEITDGNFFANEDFCGHCLLNSINSSKKRHCYVYEQMIIMIIFSCSFVCLQERIR